MTLKELKNTKGRLLGVDFGDSRTGLAISDPMRSLASGRETVRSTGLENTARLVAEYAKAEGVSGIVVGLPKNMDGSCGHRAERALRFAGLVGELTGLPVATFDERLSTVQASRYLNATDTRGTKRKGVIDTLSAQIILQDALDRMNGMD